MADSSRRIHGIGGLSAERHVAKLRQAVVVATETLIEDELCLGLEAIDVRSSALLLGLCCRPVGPGDEGTSSQAIRPQWPDWWQDAIQEPPAHSKPKRSRRSIPLAVCQEPMPAPDVLDSNSGVLLVPIPDEYVRLEGLRWAAAWERGRGSVYAVDTFGCRGEAVVCPEFCRIVAPEIDAYIEGPQTLNVSASSALSIGLRELFGQVKDAAKVPTEGLITALEANSSLKLVLPAGKIVFKDEPSTTEFCRPAARRYPCFISAVEMGARLTVSVIPPAKTSTGIPDLEDREHIERWFGVQIFALADERGKLCIKRDGGPALDPLRIHNASLEELCDYLTMGWLQTLCASPATWLLMRVASASSSDLEASLGPLPGEGFFAVVSPEIRKQVSKCQVCSKQEVVGIDMYKNARTGDESSMAICAGCAAFVPGSPSFQSKEALSQHVSRPVHQIVGACDSGLDELLSSTSSPGKSTSQRVESQISFEEAMVPPDSHVLAVGGLISLAPPAKGWRTALLDENTKLKLHQELQLLLDCDHEVLHIVRMEFEQESENLLLGFVLLHQACLQAGKEDYSGPDTSTEEEQSGPLAPLRMYKRLEMNLKQSVTPSKHHRSFKDQGPPLLVASQTRCVVLPCSLFTVRPKVIVQLEPEGGDDMQERKKMLTGQSLAEEIKHLNELIGKAHSRPPSSQGHQTAQNADQKEPYTIADFKSQMLGLQAVTNAEGAVFTDGNAFENSGAKAEQEKGSFEHTVSMQQMYQIMLDGNWSDLSSGLSTGSRPAHHSIKFDGTGIHSHTPASTGDDTPVL